MKPLLFFTLFLFGLSLPVGAQTQVVTNPAAKKEAVPATTITSDTLSLDLSKKEGIFSGSVKAVDPKFELAADELIIYFDGDNKPERLVAKGNVTIRQTDKTSSSRQAEYIVAERKIVLTGNPVVSQGANRVSGNTITIFQDSEQMKVEGGRTTAIFFPK
jgi:lipopolysaccharide export system protein LptA